MVARGVTDKILAILFLISAFVACGFEHSVANMFFLLLGLYLAGGSGASVSWMSVGENLLFATIGAYHRRDAGCGHAVLVCVFLGEEL